MVQKLTGLVLRTTEYKENDLILNILTREQGLISAKARAVRTNRSHNKGACQLLCYSEFTILSVASAERRCVRMKLASVSFASGVLANTGRPESRSVTPSPER